jgi:hypothetical protein
MIIGAAILLIGVILQFAPWALNWFGKLPGDIRIETEKGMIFIPIASMLIVSVVLTILFNLFRH